MHSWQLITNLCTKKCCLKMKCLNGCRLLQFFKIKTQGAQTLLHRHKAMHTCNFANAKISSTLHQLLSIWRVNSMNSCMHTTFVEDIASLLVHKQLLMTKARATSGKPAEMILWRFPVSCCVHSPNECIHECRRVDTKWWIMVICFLICWVVK